MWEGDETVTRFKPEPYHTSVPGYAYGGLIASLIDGHCTGTASAAMYQQEGRVKEIKGRKVVAVQMPESFVSDPAEC